LIVNSGRDFLFAVSLALLLSLFFPLPAPAVAAQSTAAQATATQAASAKSSDPVAASPAAGAQAGGIRFDDIHLGLAANPPVQCTAAFYGTVTARAPDGALCLCHQNYDGKQGLWEQLGTGKACWPDKK
jgi:hypothetical protein